MTPLLLFLLVCTTTTLAQACHPECRWQCDDPVCPAVCAPLCQPPQCERCFNESGTLVDCQATDKCATLCPQDQCEADSCPVCETLCPGNLCLGQPANCLVQCAETQCAWVCGLPAHCPRPVCQLQCEQPACAFSGALGRLAPSLTFTMMVLSLLLLITHSER